MRWENLFGDLEAQLNSEQTRLRQLEVQELVNYERSQTHLAGRLDAATGHRLDVVILGGERFSGVLASSGQGWLTLAAGPVEYFLLTAAIRSVTGIGARATDEGRARVGLKLALRAIARDRSPVRVFTVDGAPAATGTLDFVGTDFVQLAAHDVGDVLGARGAGQRLLLPLGSLAAIQRVT
ncbi:hypothetical protein [Zhihengliuella flava]|uniref:Uncharacterized protein n=1 Tax=Zhihengliuella flava TaxID=1285193 RepID=A0A931DB16_9MICC|nr:hypothetical protein [Zhihengliuella flava]MBG6085614.1 hypothetical protein [Zhihengliuella flava]